MLSAACSKDDGDSAQQAGGEAQEIRVNADVWRVMEGTRATIYDGGTLTSGSFKASSYVANTTTAYITPVQVDWVTDKWVWSDGKHYWPASGSLDFFAYMPAAIPSYIMDMSDVASQVTYTARNPQFKCKDLPMTYNSELPSDGQGSGLQEFVYALKTDRTKALDGADGVTLNFQHPFARIKLMLAASHPNVTINSITFRSIKNNGSYDHSASPEWTTTGVATDFTVTLSDAAAIFDDNPASPTQIGTDFIMIPQEFAGAIEINASWNDWGDTPVEHTVTTTIPAITWQAGYSYTYTFTITPEDLVVNLTDFTEQW